MTELNGYAVMYQSDWGGFLMDGRRVVVCLCAKNTSKSKTWRSPEEMYLTKDLSQVTESIS